MAKFFGAVRWGDQGEHSRVLDVVGSRSTVIQAIGKALNGLLGMTRVGYLCNRRPLPGEMIEAKAPFVVELVVISEDFDGQNNGSLH